MDNKKYLVIFHKDCLDGMAGAYIVRKFFGPERCEMLGMNYHDTFPDITDRNVYVVDFSFSPEVLLPELSKAQSVVIIDHHATPIAKWNNLPSDGYEKPFLRIFDKTKSGAALAWNFFYPDTEMPSAIAICQDHDLWSFEYAITKPFVAGIFARGVIDQQNHHEFARLLEEPGQMEMVAAEGEVIIDARNANIAKMTKRNLQLITINGVQVPIANIPYEYVSDFADQLLQSNLQYPFCIAYEDWLTDGVRKFSVRSRKGESVDVSLIAESFGGGGSFNTAGFTMTLSAVGLGLQDLFDRMK